MSRETIHASCVAIAGAGVLISGPSGAGKSDLALRLVDRGAVLVADDYTIVRAEGEALVASVPPTIAGRIEGRGIGLVTMPHVGIVQVAMFVALGAPVERMPDALGEHVVAGIALPVLPLAGFEASAPIKVELALARLRRVATP